MALTMDGLALGEIPLIRTTQGGENFWVAYSNSGAKYPGLNLWGLNMPVNSPNYTKYQACGGIITQNSDSAGTTIYFPYAFRYAPTVMITQYDDSLNSGSNNWSTLRPSNGPVPWIAGADSVQPGYFIFKSAVIIMWDPAILTDFTGLKAMYIAVGYGS